MMLPEDAEIEFPDGEPPPMSKWILVHDQSGSHTIPNIPYWAV